MWFLSVATVARVVAVMAVDRVEGGGEGNGGSVSVVPVIDLKLPGTQTISVWTQCGSYPQYKEKKNDS